MTAEETSEAGFASLDVPREEFEAIAEKLAPYGTPSSLPVGIAQELEIAYLTGKAEAEMAWAVGVKFKDVPLSASLAPAIAETLIPIVAKYQETAIREIADHISATLIGAEPDRQR
jgi:hypothetical protein